MHFGTFRVVKYTAVFFWNFQLTLARGLNKILLNLSKKGKEEKK